MKGMAFLTFLCCVVSFIWGVVGENNKGKNSSSKVVVGVIASTWLVLLAVTICLITRHKKKKYFQAVVTEASDNFSDENKLGEGGFGGVYKGTLPNGQEVAVKRLSRSFGQGAKEFKNETVLVAKLQHRNLVRLLGFSLAGSEKLLVYEYIPNKSLDSFLFGMLVGHNKLDE